MRVVGQRRAVGLAVAASVFGIDQWVKAMVVGPWGLDEVGETIPLLPFFAFTRTNNIGVSFGKLEATSLEMRWLLVLGTSALAMGVLVALWRARKLWDMIPLSLILGGALGNIWDRYSFGYVIDFLDLHIGDFRPFMIFNTADAAISVGAAIYLLCALFIREAEPRDALST